MDLPTPVVRGPSWWVLGTLAGVHLLVGLLELVELSWPDTVLGLGLTAAQAVLLLRFRRPSCGVFLLFSALVLVQPVLGTVWGLIGWAALVHLLVRYGVPRAGSAVLVAGIAVVAVGGMTGPQSLLDAATRTQAARDSAVAATIVAVLAGTGWARRHRERRADRRRERAARARREAALARERERIADDLNGLVLDGLVRVAELSAGCPARLARPAPEPERAMAELQGEARRALAAMRRALVVLRADDQAPPPVPDDGQRRRTPRPSRGGVVLAAVTGGLVVITSLLARPTGDPDLDLLLPSLVDMTRPVVLLLLAVQVVALGWWRSAPASALVVGTAGCVALTFHSHFEYLTDLSWLLLAYGVAAELPRWRAAVLLLAAGGAVTGAFLVTGPLFEAPPLTGFEFLLVVLTDLVVLALVWGIGADHRERRRRRDRESVALDTRETAREVAQERHRIARELHDVVAHHVSAVAVQAGAVRAVAGSDRDAVAAAAGHIQEYGRRIRAALPELVDLTPRTSVIDLDAAGVERILTPLRAGGLPVTAQVRGRPADSGDAGLFAQRILVESLTNVLRHAGASPTRVLVEHRADDIVVEVADSGRVPGDLLVGDGAGLGLIGMRERAALLGGDLEAGPAADGGWCVRARLPRRAPDRVPTPTCSA